MVRAHGQSQQSAIADIVQVMPGLESVLAGLAVAGNGAIDDARVDEFYRFIVQAKPLHDTGAELFDYDIRFLRMKRYQKLQMPGQTSDRAPATACPG